MVKQKSDLFLSFSYPCRSKYVQFLDGASLSNYSIVRYPFISNGRICERYDVDTVFRIEDNVVTVNYHSDTTPINLEVRYKIKGKIRKLNLAYHFLTLCTLESNGHNMTWVLSLLLQI